MNWTLYTPNVYRYIDNRRYIWEHDAATRQTRLEWWPGKRDSDQETLDAMHRSALSANLAVTEHGWRTRLPTQHDGQIFYQVDNIELRKPAETVKSTYVGYVSDETCDLDGDDGWGIADISRWIPVRELEHMIPSPVTAPTPPKE